MSNNRLFRRSRLRLCLWYGGVMGVILAISRLGDLHSAIAFGWKFGVCLSTAIYTAP